MPKSRESEAVIAVVDDDLSVREGLSSLIRSAGFEVEVFASAQEFLARPCAQAPGCLVLDLQLPGLSGLDLQKRMAEAGLDHCLVVRADSVHRIQESQDTLVLELWLAVQRFLGQEVTA